jgi:hypothetical protein
VWGQFLGLLDTIRTRRRMSVIFLHHAAVKQTANPTGKDWDQHRPEAIDKMWGLTHKWADVICYYGVKVTVNKDDKATGEQRYLRCNPSAAIVAGNRYGLPDEITAPPGAKHLWDAFAKEMGKAKAKAAKPSAAPASPLRRPRAPSRACPASPPPRRSRPRRTTGSTSRRGSATGRTTPCSTTRNRPGCRTDMPSRLLREGILESTAVNALSFPAEVFYRRLMSVVDDFGRFDGRPAVLRGRLYALKLDTVREADISRWIAECVKAGLIVLYTVDAKPYLLFRKLGTPRAKESKFPAPSAQTDPAPPQHASVNGCAQPHTSVPDSYSGSDSSAGSGAVAAAGAAGGTASIPAELDTEEFRAAWGEWKAERAARKYKPYTARGEAQQLRALAEYGPAVAVEAIRESIRQTWQGLFPQKVRLAPRLHQPAAPPPAADPVRAFMDKHAGKPAPGEAA